MSSVQSSVAPAGSHAIQAARVFDRACQLTGLSSSELCRRLSPRLGRENVLSRQTLAAWRQGKQSVPLAAFMAAADLAGLRPPVILALATEDFDPSALRGDLRAEGG